MRELKQITVIGLGLLGGSVGLSVLRAFRAVKLVGYSHRPSTRQKARQLAVASEISDCLRESVVNADMVILATPISTFEQILTEISDWLPKGCIVTDVGSTKALPHKWAQKILPKDVHYVGSHPIAGSEQRGVEFSRDDLFEGAKCVVTNNAKTDVEAKKRVSDFWKRLGCSMIEMSPAEHDRIFAKVSHLPHLTAASLINANDIETLKFSGRGMIDTTRIASGPENVWSDIVMANSANLAKGIEKIINELERVKRAIEKKDKKSIEEFLAKARIKRAAMMNYKIENKELES
ncbi:MAG: prephenate dehydrogenase [Phycisphaerae bacterium]|nr:prephenate dehydrogenase [Phycisphaerae bacterium]